MKLLGRAEMPPATTVSSLCAVMCCYQMLSKRGGRVWVVFDTQVWFNDLQMTCFAVQWHVYVCVPSSINLSINPITTKFWHVSSIIKFWPNGVI